MKMRIPIAMMLAAAVAVSPVPAMAQDNNVATTEAANDAAPAPADANMTAADVNAAIAEAAPPADTAVANDAAVAPAPAPRSRPFPWGVLGLVGLIGLLGRRRG
jgi:MYXO-CTERM domain-containing protein